MKGKYVEDQGDPHNHNNNNQNLHSQSHHPIFSKFPPPHLQNFPTHPHHSFPLPHSNTTTPLPPKKPKTTPTTSEDGGSGSIEVSRRPRGRPPGSKNKPKPPIVITREPEPPMTPCIIELPPGSDIIDSLTRFTRRRGIALCVLAASGTVANVTLKQPSAAAPSGTVTFHGRFDILSLSAVLLLETPPFNEGSYNVNGRLSFTITLAGPQGQIVGGKVVEPLVAAATVYVVAASFNSPSYHRLPIEDEGVAQNDGHESSPASAGGGSGGGGGMGGYNCHVGPASSEVIWGPTTARASPPPPPY